MIINNNLLKAERLEKIRNFVNVQGRATVPELSELFDVSEATIRRDLEELDGRGLIQRTHGGAVKGDGASEELPMMQRVGENKDAKVRIGRAAISMINNGDTIFLGSGTTVIEVANHLPEDINLTVITNSLPVVNALAHHPGIELIVIGGVLRQSELSMVGHVAEQAVREFRADKVFMGMFAVDAGCGFTNDYPAEIMTDRAVLSIAPKVIVLVDHSKFGRVSSTLVAPVTAANTIITDIETPEPIIQEFRELGIEVILT